MVFAMPDRVGPYKSIAEAAYKLHRDPAVLAKIYSGDPEGPLVDHEALKREYHVLIAHLSELVMQDLEAALARETNPDFPLRKNYLTRSGSVDRPAEVGDVAHTSFQEMSQYSRRGDYHQVLHALQSDTVDELLTPADSSLRRADQAAIVARAALLQEKMGPEPTGRPIRVDEVDFVLNNIKDGLVGADYGFSNELLRSLPAALAQSRPGVTYDEVVEIAERGFGLLRGPAGLNVPQLQAIFDALRSDPADASAPDLSLDPDTTPVHPAHLALNENLGTAKYASNIRDLPATSPDPAVQDLVTVRDLKHDDRGIAATYGCPARIDVLRNGRPPLVRAYLQTLNLVKHHWKLTLPGRPPIDLSRLDPAVDDTVAYSELNLDGLDATVRILPSATGRVSIELSDDSYADQLKIQADGTKLSIAGKTGPDPVGGERPTVTIRVPQPPDLTARGVTDLTADYVERVKIDTPPDGRLRIPAHQPGSHVTTGPGSRVLVLTDYYNSLWGNPIEGEGEILDLHVNPLGPAPSGVEFHRLLEYGRSDVEHLPPETRRALADNLDWISLHVPREKFSDELNEALRALPVSSATARTGSSVLKAVIQPSGAATGRARGPAVRP